MTYTGSEIYNDNPREGGKTYSRFNQPKQPEPSWIRILKQDGSEEWVPPESFAKPNYPYKSWSARD